jgi:hypothetical protein
MTNGEAHAAQLQIYSVEEESAASVVCVVRCVGGVVHWGQEFRSLACDKPVKLRPVIIVDWIRRYERSIELLDPPHSAKVRLTGEGVQELKKGDIIAAHEGVRR